MNARRITSALLGLLLCWGQTAWALQADRHVLAPPSDFEVGQDTGEKERGEPEWRLDSPGDAQPPAWSSPRPRAGFGLARKTAALTIFTLLGLHARTQSSPPEIYGPYLVERISDGDTIRIWVGDKERKDATRLIGIDTYETRKGRRAKMQAKNRRMTVDEIVRLGKEGRAHMLTKLQPGDIVGLEFDPAKPRKDHFGRWLAYVYTADGRMLNLTMVLDGYAVPYPFGKSGELTRRYHGMFMAAVAYAREHGLGIWKGRRVSKTDRSTGAITSLSRAL